jgi:hypothetical protein
MKLAALMKDCVCDAVQVLFFLIFFRRELKLRYLLSTRFTSASLVACGTSAIDTDYEEQCLWA